MKDILIIADGIVAKHFLERVLNDIKLCYKPNIYSHNRIKG